jgi:hypothetical protein
MTKHNVTDKVADLILDYYDRFSMGVLSGSVTAEWHRLKLGIITGCSISVIMFALAMNMIVKSTENECRGPRTKSGVRQSQIGACMEDLTVTTVSARKQVDSARAGKADWMGENELQANKIEVDGVEEGKGRGQIPLHHCNNTDSNHLGNSIEELWQGF